MYPMQYENSILIRSHNKVAKGLIKKLSFYSKNIFFIYLYDLLIVFQQCGVGIEKRYLGI